MGQNRVYASRWMFAAFGLAAAFGCASTGPMVVRDVSYIAVPSGDNTNFYRITVSANTEYGKSEYHSGWYPADAVDALYGDVTNESPGETRKTADDIRTEIDKAIVETTKNYLAEAQQADANDDRILGLLAAQRRVRAIAGTGVQLPEGAVELEYDPAKNMAVRRAGQKRVYVLSSDPNDVVGKIKEFSMDAETSATILRFADVLRQRNANDLDRAQARMDAGQTANDALVSQIDAVLERTDPQGSTAQISRSDAQFEVESLLVLVESLR